MESILAVLSIATFATLTPGPNNFIVMQAASKQGSTSALTMIAGIISGNIALSFVVWLGLSATIESLPWLLNIVTLVGSGYLVYVGGKMIVEELKEKSLYQTNNDAKKEENKTRNSMHFSFNGVFLFQFVNPKALLLVSTLSAELGRVYLPQLALAILLTIISSVSFVFLCIWAWLGHAFSHHLKQRNIRLVFNIIMGLLLMLPAAFLLFKTLILLKTF